MTQKYEFLAWKNRDFFFFFKIVNIGLYDLQRSSQLIRNFFCFVLAVIYTSILQLQF